MSRWAAVLAGGSGTRFWPLSRPELPKQMLPLAGERPLLREAVDRLAGLIPPERILVITGSTLLTATRRLLAELPVNNVLGEPRPASTGPALAWATHVAAQRDPHASILAMHADWFVGDDAAFRETASRALDLAETDALVTVGIVPTRPDVAYGYIELGDPLSDDAWRVARFTEKPEKAHARDLIAAGALWNSGLFAWTAMRFFTETRAVAPEIASALEQFERDGDVDAFFTNVTPIAVDVSHFERSTHVATVRGTFPWDDVGTWSALARVRPHDALGNVTVGDVQVRDASGCVVWVDDGLLVVDGVENLVVVRAHGVTLVTTAARADRLKDLLATLPDRVVRGESA